MDREKVISNLQGVHNYLKSFENTAKMGEWVADALALLKEQERKKGSWDYGTQCSVCKGTIIPPKDRKVRVNFCPWCGADMRGGYGA